MPKFSVPEGSFNMTESRTEYLIQRQPGKKKKEMEEGKMREREGRKGKGEEEQERWEGVGEADLDSRF